MNEFIDLFNTKQLLHSSSWWSFSNRCWQLLWMKVTALQRGFQQRMLDLAVQMVLIQNVSFN